MTQFADLGLAAPLVKTLETLGYETPTPIQAQAIPTLLEGKDLLGIAQTGTGKTAAFSLPILHHLNANQQDGPRRRKSVRALILAPTRELAVQIGDSIYEYGKNLGLKSTTVLGGVSIPRQARALERGVDVLVATPGRLEDLMKQGAVSLDQVSYLVLDEADQMLDMGFIHVLKRIASFLPKSRQTMMFSATMPPEIEALSKQFQTAPQKISVAPVSSTAERVNQSAYFVKQKDKPALLARLLKGRDVKRAIIFTRTKHGANRLVGQLDKVNLDAVAIHGNKNQNQRQRALNSFRDGEVIFLVATDVAARGIDIPEVSHVFNFDLPEVAEQYVHRIGRTARAGREGDAISLISDSERGLHRAIEKLTGVRLAVLSLPEGFTEERANAPAEQDDRRSRRPRSLSETGREKSGRSQGRRGERGERRDKPADNGRKRPYRFVSEEASGGAESSAHPQRRERSENAQGRSNRQEKPKQYRGENRGQEGRRGSGGRTQGKSGGQGRPGGRPSHQSGGNRGPRRQSRDG